MNKMKSKYLSLLAIAGFAAGLPYAASPAFASHEVAPDLGSAGSYTVLSAASGGAVTCTRTCCRAEFIRPATLNTFPNLV